METGYLVFFVLLIAFIVILVYLGRGKKEAATATTGLDGLPSVPDPNPGYIRGAKFGRKNQLHRLAAWTRRRMRHHQDKNESEARKMAFFEACDAIGAKGNLRLYEEVRDILDSGAISIGDVFVHRRDETKGFLVVGRPGSGKTQLLSQVLENIMLDDKVIVHDYKADYLQVFYNPAKDIIFNPLDQRCVKWDIFEGVSGEWDIESMATALIPSPSGSVDQHWTDAARNVLIGAMTHLKVNHAASNNELVNLISDIPQLVKILAENSLRGSAHLVGYPDSKEAQSVLSTFMRFTSCLKYLPDTGDADGKGMMTFRIRNWLESKQAGIIFIANYQRTQDALRPLLSLFLEVVIRTMLSQQDDLYRRVFFILDEFGQLNKVPSISSLITQGRSKGVSSWIGIQDLAQIETKYSKSIRQSITNSLSNHIIFNVIDSETADIFSREIGEVTRLKTDYTRGQSEGYQSDGDSSSNYTSSQRTSQVTERLILPSEILAMEDLQCIVKMINRDVLATEIPIVNYIPQSEAFILDERFTFAAKQTADAKPENKIESEEGENEIKD
jgi:type IV secretory pathway TraG/TraD family ATPase VirD4